MKKLFWDISGAFGDIGILFPLAIALIAKNGFNPTALLVCAGLFYILSAFYFRITMPVQPLKAMSAVAIASGLGAEVIQSAGFSMGILLVLIALTGISVKLGSLFPVSVIRGIQLGLGFILVKTGVGIMSQDLSMSVVAMVLLLLGILVKSIPPLIPVLLLGVLVAIRNSSGSGVLWGPLPMNGSLPGFQMMVSSFSILVLPQIALTFGNAIVSTENTAKILYGEQSKRLNLRSIPFSMGIANLLAGIFGGAPMCHGSGGLTAHSKFGATGPRSGYIIGFTLFFIGIVFGKSSLQLISAFPTGILGALLFYVGILHATFIRDILHEKNSAALAVVTALTGVIFGNLTVGFLVGICLHYGSRLFPVIKNTNP